MKASPEVQALFGLIVVIYALVTLCAVFWRPKLLDHPLLRMRWWRLTGPRASRGAAGFASGLWLTVGAMVLANAFNLVHHWEARWTLVILAFFFVGAVVAQLIASARGAR